MHDLIEIGFNGFFQTQLNSGDAIPARIAAEHRGGYEVWSQRGEGLAKLSGRFSHENGDLSPGVGDWVLLRAHPASGTTTVIEGLLERRTVFTRGAAGRQSVGQVVAANVDVVFAVCGLDGDYNIRRIERYLARIWASGAQPVVVLNKADICEDVGGYVAEVEVSSMGVPVITTSAMEGTGLEAIWAHLGPGLTAAFVGSSGAGKSTLINALLGREHMATGAVREDDSKGRHTTTHRQLITLPGGGLLVDTPGMRELQLFDEDGIDSVFADIEELASRCRFNDCGHTGEPGCAVLEAVDEGGLDPDRLEHFHKLKDEAGSYALRQDERLRRKVDKSFGKMLKRDGKLISRLKGGK